MKLAGELWISPCIRKVEAVEKAERLSYRLRRKSEIKLQKHLLYKPGPGFRPQHLKRAPAIKANFRLAQPTGSLRIIGKDLLGQGCNTSNAHGTVRFIVRQCLTATPAMNQSPPRNDKGVDLLIAHPMMRKRLHRSQWKALINQPGQITIRTQRCDSQLALHASIEHGWLPSGLILSSLRHGTPLAMCRDYSGILPTSTISAGTTVSAKNHSPAGRLTMNSVFPGWLSKLICPLNCPTTMRCAISRPRPVPTPTGLVV